MSDLAQRTTVELSFSLGSLLIKGLPEPYSEGLNPLVNFTAVKWDSRTLEWRAPANEYREIVLKLHAQPEIKFIDHAKLYEKIDLTLQQKILPREHQVKAIEAWRKANYVGVVSLPTGAGKTILAVMAIAELKRPALIIVPTIDLLYQWKGTLENYFNQSIGAYGGGNKTLETITVATYDSAALIMETYGNRFGFVVFDECHHLPAPQYQNIAYSTIAPFRLGLSATVERADGKEQLIYELIGPLVYQAQISQMLDKVLSPYDVVSIRVQLTSEEHEQYSVNRKLYTDFLRRQGIDFSSPGGWMEFVFRSARSSEGRQAMKAYRIQKKIAQNAEQKFVELWLILMKHKKDRVIIFTDDNAHAYRVGREFVLPVITHQTKPQERKFFLDSFRSGHFRVLVTAKVLNEGVDVPEASVAIVMSGSAGVREHVQRLGRILRHRPDKRAVLYEITAAETSEQSVQRRRRMHDAYQESSPV